MQLALLSDPYDLTSPDGFIHTSTRLPDGQLQLEVRFERIAPNFVGFAIDPHYVEFNLKSTLAQLGVESRLSAIELEPKAHRASCQVKLLGYGELAQKMLTFVHAGMAIGKLFAADPNRRVRDPDYLHRMFGRSDEQGTPLLSLGGLQGSSDLILERIEGRTIAYLSLRPGVVRYRATIEGMLPTIALALQNRISTRRLLSLHQEMDTLAPRLVQPQQLLLVRTLPLHIRTAFARVVDSLLPQGYQHTSARILDPSTTASGDIYELYGDSPREISDIPLEFYTLEPRREYVFFKDRDQLQSSLEQPELLFNAFKSAPEDPTVKASTFVVKGTQLKQLQEPEWSSCQVYGHQFPGIWHSDRQALMVERYIEQQPEYPFLRSIELGQTTSQGVLLTKYFPSPLMKRMILGHQVLKCLKGLYFQKPSQHYGDFFSHEDHNFLADLWRFAVPVFWVDAVTGRVLQYVQKNENNSGIFVPLSKASLYLNATVFGAYGSNLIEGSFEQELQELMEGLLELRNRVDHPKLNPSTPLAFVTGGGPGAMEVGNRVAQSLDLLSCAHIVDFSQKGQVINEQRQNPHVEAKMTYRIDKLVERQADFNLDFPIFVMGGMGTDFEFHLEQVRRKTGAVTVSPILLFGSTEYWSDKLTGPFQRNLLTGTIRGSEWVSKCFYCVQNAAQGLQIYEAYFKGQLPMGPDAGFDPRGFVVVSEQGSDRPNS